MKTRKVVLFILVIVGSVVLLASPSAGRPGRSTGATPAWRANRLDLYTTLSRVGIGTSNPAFWPAGRLVVTEAHEGDHLMSVHDDKVVSDVNVGIGMDTPTSHLHITNWGNGADILTVDDVEAYASVPLQVVTDAGTGSGRVAHFENTSDGHGISIRVGGSADPNSDNYFITFQDSGGTTVGRVEGQDQADYLSSWDLWWDTGMVTLQTLLNNAMQVACGAQLDLLEVGVLQLQGWAVIAHWAQREIRTASKRGISYESGSSDYAEWLEKADPEEVFSFGDVVGVRAGKVSKDTADADHCMVISLNPIMLGNMPDEDRVADFEKVAFMGQVLVKVAGPVRKGDYIMPSGWNDGFGVAVSPDDMALHDYGRIVGVAWEESPAGAGISYINTAVGINTNDLVAEMTRQRREIEALKAKSNAIVTYLQSKDPSFPTELFEDAAEAPHEEPLRTPAAAAPEDPKSSLAAFLRENPQMLEAVLAEARDSMKARGLDYTRYEQTRRLLTDPEYFLGILEGYRRR